MGYLSDFSNFDEGLVDVKLHEETILKNEIQDDTNFSKFEPIVLSLYPDKKINSNVINFETDELILLDGHHRWKYACLLYTSPSPRDPKTSRMPSSA